MQHCHLAQELTDLLSASDRYFISTLDPFNPGKSLVHDVMKMLDGGQTVPGDFLMELLKKSIAQHEVLPNVIQVNRSRFSLDEDHQAHVDALDLLAYSGGLTVVGDLHGQYLDFANLLRNPDFGGFPSAYNRFILNGDMVDRGLFSVEIIVVATLIKLFYPEDMHLLRGNHECHSMNVTHGFHEELNRKYPGNILLRSQFTKLFNALPVAAVIENQVFVTHGGLGAQVCTMTIEQINRLNRFQTSWKCQPIYELMWSGENTTATSSSVHDDVSFLFEILCIIILGPPVLCRSVEVARHYRLCAWARHCVFRPRHNQVFSRTQQPAVDDPLPPALRGGLQDAA